MIDEQAVSRQGKRIRKALGDLEADLGRGLTAEDVVTAASAPDHALHDYFEWDDAIAGHEWRKGQARALMRRVRVRVVEDVPTGERRIFKVAGYANVVQDNRREYVPTRAAMLNPELRAQILARALREMQAWADRYRIFTEFAEIVAAVQKATLKTRKGGKRSA